MLTVFAQRSFELSAPQGDGSSLREHLQTVEKQTGKRPKELDMPPFPYALHREWGWFVELHAARQSNGFSMSSLSYTEMKSYFALIDEVPSPRQVKLLRTLDGIAIKHYVDASKKSKPARRSQ